MTEPTACLARVRAGYASYSDIEKKIADLLLEHPEHVIHSSISGLGEQLGVADSTIFRFCKRLGFKGFQAMKIALAAEIVSPLHQIHEEITPDDDVRTVARKVFHASQKALTDTEQLLDETTLEQVVRALIGARRIEIYGAGGSALVAMDAYHKWMRAGLPVFATLDTHIQLMSASQLQAGDVAIVISHSGATMDMLQIAELLKVRGVALIVLTSYAKSPLSRLADHVLYTASDETDYRTEAMASRLAELCLFDALFVNLMRARGQEGQESLQRIRQALEIKRM
ncbi:MurR/RpiR family transcriptional regulator [Exiguobacterium flavidum]|uniref:MurR/RpiR family transcriptional regulator n=1 Tax=Exiguobacterium flavidum TaxID=2184695 RepID=UPI000DF7D6E4|nr:MurR/RpiR family transcriptional regulator [Exiguobacterium flavidum]